MWVTRPESTCEILVLLVCKRLGAEEHDEMIEERLVDLVELAVAGIEKRRGVISHPLVDAHVDRQ